MQQGRPDDGAVSARPQLHRARRAPAVLRQRVVRADLPDRREVRRVRARRQGRGRGRARRAARDRARGRRRQRPQGQRDSFQAARRQRGRGARQDLRDRGARDRDAEAPADVAHSGQRSHRRQFERPGRPQPADAARRRHGGAHARTSSTRIADPWRRAASASCATAIFATCTARRARRRPTKAGIARSARSRRRSRYAAQGSHRRGARGRGERPPRARARDGPVGGVPARSGQSRDARERPARPARAAAAAHRVPVGQVRARRHEGRDGVRARPHERARRNGAANVRTVDRRRRDGRHVPHGRRSAHVGGRPALAHARPSESLPRRLRDVSDDHRVAADAHDRGVRAARGADDQDRAPRAARRRLGAGAV